MDIGELDDRERAVPAEARAASGSCEHNSSKKLPDPEEQGECQQGMDETPS